VTRARPYQLSLFGDNYRPPSIGAEAFGLNGWVRNLTGLGDVLDFNFIDSAGSSRYFGGFSVPVMDSGTQVFFHFDEGDSSVIEQPLKSLDIQSKVHNLEGGFSYPLINSLRKRSMPGNCCWIWNGARGGCTVLCMNPNPRWPPTDAPLSI
jgi:hemolysin activation/secretion protein